MASLTEISQLKLTLLDVTNNDLSGLPPELGLVTTLRRLVLEGNPFRSLRRDLISGPPPALLKSLRNKLPEDQSYEGPQAEARSGNLFGESEAGRAASMARAVAAGGSDGVHMNSADFAALGRVDGPRSREQPSVPWTALGRVDGPRSLGQPSVAWTALGPVDGPRSRGQPSVPWTALGPVDSPLSRGQPSVAWTALGPVDSPRSRG
ncbi:hypothetical protein CYMTET_36458 [Cymbomonas tetramitiformis]|uniref:Uncharacterized protein n=1 Tax=Cymbomonas tetramitiformis TaxID=36881 RepID=A0AAE0CFV7_9CHLO|nr:hypothetical protein CYMTET_36458 [Cymbomonas tetramitiformis]